MSFRCLCCLDTLSLNLQKVFEKRKKTFFVTFALFLSGSNQLDERFCIQWNYFRQNPLWDHVWKDGHKKFHLKFEIQHIIWYPKFHIWWQYKKLDHRTIFEDNQYLNLPSEIKYLQSLQGCLNMDLAEPADWASKSQNKFTLWSFISDQQYIKSPISDLWRQMINMMDLIGRCPANWAKRQTFTI